MTITSITDEFMRQMLAKTKQYSVVILRAGPNKNEESVDTIIWEHGRRNFALRAEGVLPIVCAVSDGSDILGVGIFDATVEETKALMNVDPGIKAGVFTYEVHVGRSFPGDRLPE